jgi:hypothetical protein
MDLDLRGERLEEKDWGIDISVPKIEVLRIRFSELKREGNVAGGLVDSKPDGESGEAKFIIQF